jgi:hypothetical protein
MTDAGGGKRVGRLGAGSIIGIGALLFAILWGFWALNTPNVAQKITRRRAAELGAAGRTSPYQEFSTIWSVLEMEGADVIEWRAKAFTDPARPALELTLRSAAPLPGDIFTLSPFLIGEGRSRVLSWTSNHPTQYAEGWWSVTAFGTRADLAVIADQSVYRIRLGNREYDLSAHSLAQCRGILGRLTEASSP